MTNGPIAKPAKYKTSVEDPGIPGVFALLENELMFRPNDPACPMELHLGFRYIEDIYMTGDTTKIPSMFKVIRKDGIYFFEFESVRDLWGLGASQIASSAREDTPWRTVVTFSDV
ncbi:hypothetical protein M0R45_028109 [Rubus argutus]|uniref:Uncharacterized protein n=1 Tax=Rubus argutus TaxID=59490 RepID=A0AAW1W678_RUBAR